MQGKTIASCGHTIKKVMWNITYLEQKLDKNTGEWEETEITAVVCPKCLQSYEKKIIEKTKVRID